MSNLFLGIRVKSKSGRLGCSVPNSYIERRFVSHQCYQIDAQNVNVYSAHIFDDTNTVN